MSSGRSSTVPLLARVCLELGTWQWALSPGLDDDSIQGIITFISLIFGFVSIADFSCE